MAQSKALRLVHADECGEYKRDWTTQLDVSFKLYEVHRYQNSIGAHDLQLPLGISLPLRLSQIIKSDPQAPRCHTISSISTFMH